jgi:hypothetical protein
LLASAAAATAAARRCGVQVQGRVRRPTASNSGSFGFLEWGASDSAAPFVPVDTDTDMVVVWWPGQQPAGRKSEDRMVFWVEVGAARPTTVIHDDGADSQH